MTVQVVADSQSKGRTERLTEIESKEFIRQAGIPVIDTRLAKTKKQAIELSKELGYPVALKIISPDVIHKSDGGGVKLGITGATQAGKAYSAMK